MGDTEVSTSMRNFYLMLSPPDGQTVAVNAGLVPSSEEVYEEEQRDVLRSWALLTESGVVDSMSDAADWMSDIMVSGEFDPDEMEDDDIVTVGFDLDHPESDEFMRAIPYGELRKMHQQVKDSAYNTILGCLVASISKLLDEELITVVNLERAVDE
jgi:hypothetical protein